MVAVSIFRSEIPKQLRDLDRSRRDVPSHPFQQLILAKVTDATEITTGSYRRWLYTIVEATIGTTTNYIPTNSANEGAYYALSASELSNPGTYYSYGVQKANVPAGFDAVRIPTNTYVVAMKWWRQDGTSIYIIINTQAIDGACP